MDAKQSIYLNPSWSKGYYRAGTVLIQMGQFEGGMNMLKKGLDHCKDNKDLQMALDLGSLFFDAYKKGSEIRTAPISNAINSAILHNCQVLTGEKFADLATAVTMTISDNSTRCVRQGFIDQSGEIVSLDSSVRFYPYFFLSISLSSLPA